MQWTSTSMATCFFPSSSSERGGKCSTRLQQQACGIRRQPSSKASCLRNGVSTYLTQAMEGLTPSLTSAATWRIISLFLYGPFQELALPQGVGEWLAYSERPNPSPELACLLASRPLCFPHISKFTWPPSALQIVSVTSLTLCPTTCCHCVNLPMCGL